MLPISLVQNFPNQHHAFQIGKLVLTSQFAMLEILPRNFPLSSLEDRIFQRSHRVFH